MKTMTKHTLLNIREHSRLSVTCGCGNLRWPTDYGTGQQLAGIITLSMATVRHVAYILTRKRKIIYYVIKDVTKTKLTGFAENPRQQIVDC